MKIAIFLPHMGSGGVERSTSILAHELAERGHHVTVLTLGTPRTPNRQFDDLNYVHLGARRVLTGVPRLARYLRREKPDAVISSQSYANVAMMISSELARFKGRVLLTERLNVSASVSSRGSVKTRMTFLLMRLLYRRASAIVAISEGVAADISEIAKLSPDRISVIYNPVNHPDIHSRAQETADCPWFGGPALRVVTTVARLERQKNVGSLIEAFALLDGEDLRLLIVGDGSERERLEQLAKRLGISDRVHFTGTVTNPYSYVAQSHLFVLSSLYEGLGNVLVEALALRVPVVSTDCPSGPAEILEHGRFGLLVEPGDTEALAEAMTEALADYPAMQAMAEEAQASLARFAPETAVSEYLKLLSSK